MALFYEAADAISHIRSPFGFSNEFEEVKRGENESKQQFEARKNASVVFYRYNQHKELFSKLHSMRYRFMASFGRDKAKPFTDIHNAVHEIVVAARMLGHLWARDYFPDAASRESHRKSIDKHEQAFWYQGEGDALQPKIEEIVKSMDSICREIILGKGTLHYFINWKWKRDG